MNKKFNLLNEINDDDNDNSDVVLIEDKNKFGALTITEEKKLKDALSETKKIMSLRLDGRKLQQAEKLFNSIENNLDMLSDPEVYQRVKENIKKAEDFKFLMDATEKQYKMLQNLLRLDSVDGQGTSARIAVAVEFGNGSSFNFGFKGD